MDHEVTGSVIGAAIEIHRRLGPGLLESAYEQCLAHELLLRQVPFAREVAIPLEYKGIKLGCGYRVDFVVAERVAVELKTVTLIEPVHEAQLLTYMRLGGWNLGLLINFNVQLLKNGIKRFAL